MIANIAAYSDEVKNHVSNPKYPRDSIVVDPSRASSMTLSVSPLVLEEFWSIFFTKLQHWSDTYIRPHTGPCVIYSSDFAWHKMMLFQVLGHLLMHNSYKVPLEHLRLRSGS